MACIGGRSGVAHAHDVAEAVRRRTDDRRVAGHRGHRQRALPAVGRGVVGRQLGLVRRPARGRVGPDLRGDGAVLARPVAAERVRRVNPAGEEPALAPMSLHDCRITARMRTARWSDDEVTAADAMDFWAFAAGAANVIMQLSWPEVGHGVVESKVDSGNLLKHPWKRRYWVGRRTVPRSERPSTAPTGRSSQPPTVTSVTTPSTVNSKCGSRHAFSSGWRTLISCCAAR